MMHPNSFLKSLWRLEARPEVFVAMSFDPRYNERFERVFKPAIEAVKIRGEALSAKRVDLSHTGDSILTEIADGVAHAELVVADISVVGRDSATGRPFRNDNVMYEVGLALACRTPAEVILVKDDQEKALFDVSTIPYLWIDFNNADAAIRTLVFQMNHRLLERARIEDARVQLVASQMGPNDVGVMRGVLKHASETWFLTKSNAFQAQALERLLDKQIFQRVEIAPEGQPAYRWTPLGLTVASLVCPPNPSPKLE